MIKFSDGYVRVDPGREEYGIRYGPRLEANLHLRWNEVVDVDRRDGNRARVVHKDFLRIGTTGRNEWKLGAWWSRYRDERNSSPADRFMLNVQLVLIELSWTRTFDLHPDYHDVYKVTTLDGKVAVEEL